MTAASIVFGRRAFFLRLQHEYTWAFNTIDIFCLQRPSRAVAADQPRRSTARRAAAYLTGRAVFKHPPLSSSCRKHRADVEPRRRRSRPKYCRDRTDRPDAAAGRRIAANERRPIAAYTGRLCPYRLHYFSTRRFSNKYASPIFRITSAASQQTSQQNDTYS